MPRTLALIFPVLMVFFAFLGHFGVSLPPFRFLNDPLGVARNASTTELVRVARVIDGDTIEIEGGERVRYIGIDTPETVDPRKAVQCFGPEASARNRELVGGKYVKLVRDVSNRDKYGRLLRYVFIPNDSGALFVNLELVKEGYARSSTYPPDVGYAAEFKEMEQDAKALGEGIWKKCGSDLRAAAAISAVEGAPDPSCTVKGNINGSGEKIYHVPGCLYYEKTKIDAARGERWFCSEADAAAAGWRKAAHCP